MCESRTSYILRKLFAEALIFTDAIYEVRDSHMCAWTFDTHFIKRPADLKGHDGCKVSPPVWSILFGQNADLTNGHDCIIIKPVKQAWFAWGDILRKS